MTATILAVSANAAHTFSKQPRTSIRLLEGIGVEGDAHAGATVQHLYLKRRNASAPNLSQVHLLASERLIELATQGFSVQPGELGENILTCGIELHHLPLGTKLHLGGEAIVALTGLRTPCAQIDNFRAGLEQQMWGPRDASGQRARRVGVMSIVLHGGLVANGDSIQVVLPAEPHRSLGPI
jgi:MOSC domain-containing protein YiiM